MAKTYHVGDKPRVTGTLEDADGVDTDPSALTFSYRDPSGNLTTYTYGVDGELVKSAVGIYYADVDIDEHGRWWYQSASTGTGQATDC